jgi:hypothetical protein
VRGCLNVIGSAMAFLMVFFLIFGIGFFVANQLFFKEKVEGTIPEDFPVLVMYQKSAGHGYTGTIVPYGELTAFKDSHPDFTIEETEVILILNQETPGTLTFGRQYRKMDASSWRLNSATMMTGSIQAGIRQKINPLRQPSTGIISGLV